VGPAVSGRAGEARALAGASGRDAVARLGCGIGLALVWLLGLGEGRKRTGRAQGKEEKGPVRGLGRDRKRKGSGLGFWGLGWPGGKRATWAGFRSPISLIFLSLFFFKLNSN